MIREMEKGREREQNQNSQHLHFIDWEPVILTLLRNRTSQIILYYLYHAFSYNYYINQQMHIVRYNL
jgi:hypothetical protein